MEDRRRIAHFDLGLFRVIKFAQRAVAHATHATINAHARCESQMTLPCALPENESAIAPIP
jgi:hypothetical protein